MVLDKTNACQRSNCAESGSGTTLSSFALSRQELEKMDLKLCLFQPLICCCCCMPICGADPPTTCCCCHAASICGFPCYSRLVQSPTAAKSQRGRDITAEKQGSEAATVPHSYDSDNERKKGRDADTENKKDRSSEPVSQHSSQILTQPQ